MQSPAVGRAVAEELLRGESSLDLTPYRLERFRAKRSFRNTLVLRASLEREPEPR